MNETELKYEAEKNIDLFSANFDHPGYQQIDGDKENVIFGINSSYRIWYNNVSTSYPLHWHESYEIIMPIVNYYEVKVDGTNYHVVPGEIMFIPSGTLHECIAPPDGTRFSFQLDISKLQKLSGFAPIQHLLSLPFVFTRSEYPLIYDDIFHILLKIKDEYFIRNDLFEISIHSLILEMFTLLAYDKIKRQEMVEGGIKLGRKYTKKFNDLLQYIESHYTEDLTLEICADHMGFSKFHFSRLFKQYTSFTFCDYISFRRIKAAEALLANPEIAVTEVAMLTGFPSIPTFNRLFKKYKGCTPSEFRSKVRMMIYKNEK